MWLDDCVVPPNASSAQFVIQVNQNLTLVLVTWWFARNQLLNNMWILLLFLDQKSRIEVIPSFVLTDLCNRSWKNCLLEEPAPKPSSPNLPPPTRKTLCETHNPQNSGSRKTYAQLHAPQISLVALTSAPISTVLTILSRNRIQHRKRATKGSSIHWWVKFWLNFYTDWCLDTVFILLFIYHFGPVANCDTLGLCFGIIILQYWDCLSESKGVDGHVFWEIAVS